MVCKKIEKKLNRRLYETKPDTKSVLSGELTLQ